MRDLKDAGFNITGLDFDNKCIQVAKKFGNVIHGSINDLDKIFTNDSFDMVIASHVLEHMENPKQVLDKIKKVTKRWILIAVPNPLWPKGIVKYNLILRRNYSNKGHLYCWDRSHFTNFLENHCGLKIERWGIDGVQIIPFKYIRKLLASIGMLDLIEIRLGGLILPYFSTSLITLCTF